MRQCAEEPLSRILARILLLAAFLPARVPEIGSEWRIGRREDDGNAPRRAEDDGSAAARDALRRLFVVATRWWGLRGIVIAHGMAAA
ncbi:hypothetical protein JCM13591A_08090 [Microbacterium xylanilyticum]